MDILLEISKRQHLAEIAGRIQAAERTQGKTAPDRATKLYRNTVGARNPGCRFWLQLLVGNAQQHLGAAVQMHVVAARCDQGALRSIAGGRGKRQSLEAD